MCLRVPLAVIWLTVYRQLQVLALGLRTTAPSGTNVWRKDGQTWNSRDPSIRIERDLVPESISYLSQFWPRGVSVASLSLKLVIKTHPTFKIIWSKLWNFICLWINLLSFPMNDLRGPLAVTWLTVYRQLQVPAQRTLTRPPPGTYVWRKNVQTWNSQDPSVRLGRRLVPESISYLSWFTPRDISVGSLSSTLVIKTNLTFETIWW